MRPPVKRYKKRYRPPVSATDDVKPYREPTIIVLMSMTICIQIYLR